MSTTSLMRKPPAGRLRDRRPDRHRRIESANLVRLIVEDVEQHPPGLARDRQRRRELGDAADAGRDVRDAKELPIGEMPNGLA